MTKEFNTDIAVSGEITATTFIGDGSQLTNLPGGIVWSAKTSNYTAVANEGILANTSAGSFTVTLPASPANGDIVAFIDSHSQFDINNLIIGRNGLLIQGAASNLEIDVKDASFQLVYTGATTGWKLDTFLPSRRELLLINNQIGITYSLVLSDGGKYLRLENSSPISLTVPLNSSVPFEIGTVITISQVGAGQVTVGGSGVTFNAWKGLKTPGQYTSIQIIKVDTNTWDVIGGIA